MVASAGDIVDEVHGAINGETTFGSQFWWKLFLGPIMTEMYGLHFLLPVTFCRLVIPGLTLGSFRGTIQT